MWRHIHFSRTSWWIVPSRSTMKCAQTPGSSPSSTSGALAAKCCSAGPKVVVAVKCSTIAFGAQQARAVEAVVALGVGARLAHALGAERDRRPADRAASAPRAGPAAVGRGPRPARRRPRRGPPARGGARPRRRAGRRASSTTNALDRGKRRVLPARRRPASRGQPPRGQPAAARVGAHDRAVGAAGEVHEPEGLVVAGP